MQSKRYDYINKILYEEAFKDILNIDPHSKREVMISTILPTKRRFRADFYCPSIKTIIEINGGVWISGRHNRASGYLLELQKSNLINLYGFIYLQYSYCQLSAGSLKSDLLLMKKT